MCLKDDYDKDRNAKINFEKSGVLIIGGDNEKAKQYAEIFSCQIDSFPLSYLGKTASANRVHVIDWARMEDKSSKKNLTNRKEIPCPMGEEQFLLIIVLTNTPVYHMSM
jgi:hypothetical protein